jgi:hypothetical protein
MIIRTFIGSSQEARPIAAQLQVHLSAVQGLAVDGWWHSFAPGSITIDRLISLTNQYDCAVFLFTPDDISVMRDQTIKIARDNVVFEAGLFMKACGRERAIIVAPDSTDGSKTHILSDLSGLTILKFAAPKDERDWDAKLSAIATQISRHILSFAHDPNNKSASFLGPWEGHMFQALDSELDHDCEPGSIGTYPLSAEFFARCERIGAHLVLRGDIYPGVDSLRLWVLGDILADKILRCDYGYTSYMDLEGQQHKMNTATAGSIILRSDAVGQRIKGRFAGYGLLTEKIVSGEFALSKVR